jgi:hypothetical protein
LSPSAAISLLESTILLLLDDTGFCSKLSRPQYSPPPWLDNFRNKTPHCEFVTPANSSSCCCCCCGSTTSAGWSSSSSPYTSHTPWIIINNSPYPKAAGPRHTHTHTHKHRSNNMRVESTVKLMQFNSTNDILMQLSPQRLRKNCAYIMSRKSSLHWKNFLPSCDYRISSSSNYCSLCI